MSATCLLSCRCWRAMRVVFVVRPAHNCTQEAALPSACTYPQHLVAAAPLLLKKRVKATRTPSPASAIAWKSRVETGSLMQHVVYCSKCQRHTAAVEHGTPQALLAATAHYICTATSGLATMSIGNQQLLLCRLLLAASHLLAWSWNAFLSRIHTAASGNTAPAHSAKAPHNITKSEQRR